MQGKESEDDSNASVKAQLSQPLLFQFPNNSLPDHYPMIPGSQEEDVLNVKTVKSGYVQPYLVERQTETFSLIEVAMDLVTCREKIQSDLANFMKEIVAARDFACPMYDQSQSNSVTFKIPSRSTLSESRKENWLNDLAKVDEPLSKLIKNVPHGYRGEKVLEVMAQKKIPYQRATWYIKIVRLNEVYLMKKREKYSKFNAFEDCSKDWTLLFCSYLGKLLNTLVINRNGDFLDHWNYLIHLFYWQLKEGMMEISRIINFVCDLLEQQNFNEQHFKYACEFIMLIKEELESFCSFGFAHLLHSFIDRFIDIGDDQFLDSFLELTSNPREKVISPHLNVPILKPFWKLLCHDSLSVIPKWWVKACLELPGSEELVAPASILLSRFAPSCLSESDWLNCALNSFSLNTDLSQIIECFDLESDLLCLFEWFDTCEKFPINLRLCITVSVIKGSFNRVDKNARKLNLTLLLIEYCEQESFNIENLCLLLNELIDERLFSYGNFIQSMVRKNSCAADPQKYLYFLENLAFHRLSPELLLQRSVLLHGPCRRPEELDPEVEISQDLEILVITGSREGDSGDWGKTQMQLRQCSNIGVKKKVAWIIYKRIIWEKERIYKTLSESSLLRYLMALNELDDLKYLFKAFELVLGDFELRKNVSSFIKNCLESLTLELAAFDCELLKGLLQMIPAKEAPCISSLCDILFHGDKSLKIERETRQFIRRVDASNCSNGSSVLCADSPLATDYLMSSNMLLDGTISIPNSRFPSDSVTFYSFHYFANSKRQKRRLSASNISNILSKQGRQRKSDPLLNGPFNMEIFLRLLEIDWNGDRILCFCCSGTCIKSNLQEHFFQTLCQNLIPLWESEFRQEFVQVLWKESLVLGSIPVIWERIWCHLWEEYELMREGFGFSQFFKAEADKLVNSKLGSAVFSRLGGNFINIWLQISERETSLLDNNRTLVNHYLANDSSIWSSLVPQYQLAAVEGNELVADALDSLFWSELWTRPVFDCRILKYLAAISKFDLKGHNEVFKAIVVKRTTGKSNSNCASDNLFKREKQLFSSGSESHYRSSSVSPPLLNNNNNSNQSSMAADSTIDDKPTNSSNSFPTVWELVEGYSSEYPLNPFLKAFTVFNMSSEQGGVVGVEKPFGSFVFGLDNDNNDDWLSKALQSKESSTNGGSSIKVKSNSNSRKRARNSSITNEALNANQSSTTTNQSSMVNQTSATLMTNVPPLPLSFMNILNEQRSNHQSNNEGDYEEGEIV